MNTQQLIDILQELGYPLKHSSNYIQTKAIYRNGDDPTSIAIYPHNNLVVDFVTSEKFSINELIRRTLNLTSLNEVQKWLEAKNINGFNIQKSIEKPKVKIGKKFDKDLLSNILPIYDYAKNRGITETICKQLKCGEVGDIKWEMKKRFVFPIFNSKNEIVGFTGRSLDNRNPKYKHLGEKKKFVWPAFDNWKLIREKKEVILVESPFCVLKLYDCDIKNVLCLFGTEISWALVNFCLRLNLDKIIISTNNEDSQIGNSAAHKVYARLKKYFDNRSLVIRLPYKKDFCEMTDSEIKQWYKG